MILNDRLLLSPVPILIHGIGHIVPTKLIDIFKLGQNEYGQNLYDGKLNVLRITVKDFFDLIANEQLKTEYESLPDEDRACIRVFDCWCLCDETIQVLLDSLDFFIAEKLIWNQKTECIETYSDDQQIVGTIDRENYGSLCSIILRLNYIEETQYENGKPKNKKAAEIMEKLAKAQKEASESKKNIDMTLENLLSAMCIQSNSYGFNNIFELTVYQFYDQFYRQNIQNQIDVTSLRWSAWGTEPFDFTLWYKAMKK